MTTEISLLTGCKLTCFEGSERGTCGCVRPSDCHAQRLAGWPAAREEAVQRMLRLMALGVSQPQPAPVDEFAKPQESEAVTAVRLLLRARRREDEV